MSKVAVRAPAATHPAPPELARSTKPSAPARREPDGDVLQTLTDRALGGADGSRIVQRKGVDPGYGDLVAAAHADVRAVQRVVNDLASASGEVPFRTEMESAFGEDFSSVRANVGQREALAGIAAYAATAGERMAFASGAPGREVVAHELAHVVQGRRAGMVAAPALPTMSTPDDAAEREAHTVALLAASGQRVRPSARPSADLHRAMHGEHDFLYGKAKLDANSTLSSAGIRANLVTITFKPFSTGPITKEKAIRFIQTVQLTPDDPSLKPNKPFDPIATSATEGHFITAAGDSLRSVSIKVYDTPNGALAIYEANKDTLLALPNIPLLLVDTKLPKGVPLTIPKATKAGFHVDIREETLAKKAQGSLPYYTGDTEVGASQAGHNTAVEQKDATLEDKPNARFPAHFRFESAIISHDPHLYYGVVNWGFRTDDYGITDDPPTFLEAPTPTFSAALAKFDTHFSNRHTVKPGETLNHISILYFGTEKKAKDIYDTNKSVIPTADVDTPLAAGTLLVIPGISSPSASPGSIQDSNPAAPSSKYDVLPH